MLTPTQVVFVLSLLSALIGALLLTPVVRGLSRRFGFVDKPDGGRKNHATAVALGGGVAVFLSTVIAAGFAFSLGEWMDVDIWQKPDEPVLFGILVASALTVLLGLLDDKFAMRGRHKLLGQVAITSVLIGSGLEIEKFTVFGSEIHLGAFSIPFTMFWLLGAINAINLIDGIDGLASSVGFVLCLTIAVISGFLHQFAEGVIVVALAGSLLGFLRYNFAPASIYLGDAGSMLIGMLIGSIAIHTSVKAPAAFAMAVPVAIWSIPILDSAAAILRRKLTGRSVFAADRGHLHHSLLVKGWSVRQASLFIALACATTCLGAVLSVVFENEFWALAMVASVVTLLVFTKTFGHIEFALVRRHIPIVSRQKSGEDKANGHRAHSIQLQGAREWDNLWAAIVESAEAYQLIRARLTIDIPAIHESYYASWRSNRPIATATESVWRLHLPLSVSGERVGQLELRGFAEEGQSSLTLTTQALEYLEPLEDDIRRIREDIEEEHDASFPARSLTRLMPTGPGLGNSGDLASPHPLESGA